MPQTWRVRHITRYVYEQPVDLAAHMLHLRPRELPHQRVLSQSARCIPDTATWRSGQDHFGNQVAWLFLDRPHASFEVASEAVLRIVPPEAWLPEATPRWEQIAHDALSGPEAWQLAEFVFDSPLAPALPAARDYVQLSFPPNRPVLQGLLDLNARITQDFAYRPGATTVSTPIAQVLSRRAGVCQDFAQVMISGLRSLGLPARYVSGYIRTCSPPGQQRQRGLDQSHAWVGCWIGAQRGWVDVDPTNALLVRDQHVVVGWGRDFSDVSPVRGVILGGGNHSLHVSVDLDPVDGTVPDR